MAAGGKLNMVVSDDELFDNGADADDDWEEEQEEEEEEEGGEGSGQETKPPLDLPATTGAEFNALYSFKL